MTHLLHGLSFEQSSPEIDQELGFQIKLIEALLLEKARELLPDGSVQTWGEKLHDGSQTWVGLHEETLQTPYAELLEVLRSLIPVAGNLFVDLGAGYGRLGFLLEKFYPGVVFRGYEFVPERVVEGNRVFAKFNCLNSTLITQDLTQDDFKLPEAAYYFLYDFGKIPHMRKILDQLSDLADRRNFSLIARGDGVRSLIARDYPWLRESVRFENLSLYETSWAVVL